MCLEKLEKVKKQKYGYKVFYRKLGDSSLYGEFRTPHTFRPVNKWLDEKDYRDISVPYLNCLYNDEEYPIGWHVFTNRRSAVSWTLGSSYLVVRKVEIKNIVASGVQNTADGKAPVLVAEKIKILEE